MGDWAWKHAKIQPVLYHRFGQALANIGSCPRVHGFVAGYGLIDETVSPPELQKIEDSLQEIPNILYSGTPECEFSDNRTLCKCTIPEGAVSEPVKCTMIGLLDVDGALLAVCTFLPEWITPEKRYENYVYINFPTSEG